MQPPATCGTCGRWVWSFQDGGLLQSCGRARCGPPGPRSRHGPAVLDRIDRIQRPPVLGSRALLPSGVASACVPLAGAHDPLPSRPCTPVQAVEVPLEIAQTAAVAEVVHAAVGIVRSPVFVTGAMPLFCELFFSVWEGERGAGGEGVPAGIPAGGSVQ